MAPKQKTRAVRPEAKDHLFLGFHLSIHPFSTRSVVMGKLPAFLAGYALLISRYSQTFFSVLSLNGFSPLMATSSVQTLGRNPYKHPVR